MAYLDIITLDDAKTYLRVDDTLTDDDVRITSMIKAALSTIERMTNILVYARAKTYLFDDYCVRVYDYPINSLTSPLDATVTAKTLYTIYETSNSTDLELILNVGYSYPTDVPSEIIEAGLEYVKYMYYDHETNATNKGQMPMYIVSMIDMLRRFVI